MGNSAWRTLMLLLYICNRFFSKFCPLMVACRITVHPFCFNILPKKEVSLEDTHYSLYCLFKYFTFKVGKINFWKKKYKGRGSWLALFAARDSGSPGVRASSGVHIERTETLGIRKAVKCLRVALDVQVGRSVFYLHL